MSTSQLSAFPIGTIVAYAGNPANAAELTALQDQGWFLCDGAAYDKKDYAALYAAIGAANGASGNTFNVPDLRSRFLRGTSGDAAGIDPDAGARLAAAPGGASGNQTGSLQKYATAFPSSPWVTQQAGLHAHTCEHLTSDMHQAWEGSTYSMARWSGPEAVDLGGAHFHTIVGFDAVTAPLSIALFFIIKANEPQAPTGTVPAGALGGYGGALPMPPAKWLKCDGTAYGVNRFPNLFGTLSYNYGGDGVTVMNVPDLRGYFVRGTNHGLHRDPDAGSRHALNTGGNVGDMVGSAQLFATGTPAALAVSSAGEHAHNLWRVPQTDHHAAWGASGPAAKNCMRWTDDPTTSSQDGDHNHSVTGGDRETRPENIYVDFIIADDNLAEAAPPIGSIMGFGGDTTDPMVIDQLLDAGWLPCNGAMTRIDDFSDLYKVIGTTFGSAPLKFAIPDLRGYFIVGAGNIPVGTAQAPRTGAPEVPFVTSTNGAHQHTMPNLPTDTATIDVVAGVDLAANNNYESPTSTVGAHTHALSGGDDESRPVNVNVDYIIRFK